MDYLQILQYHCYTAKATIKVYKFKIFKIKLFSINNNFKSKFNLLYYQLPQSITFM